MKISEIKIGEQIKARWLLKEIGVRKTNTKAPRDFLTVTLTDGIEEIKGILWNYVRIGNLLPTGKAVNVSATVGEFNDVKQLTVLNITLADNQDLTDFVPDLGYDREALYVYAMTIIDSITHPVLRAITYDIYSTYGEQLKVATAAKGVHHAGVAGLLKHSLEVCELSLGIASGYHDNENLYVDRDLIISGALLHDIGKLLTYEYVDCLIEMTTDGTLMDHIALGISMLEGYRSKTTSGVVSLLQHIVASHHGKLEWGSPVLPIFAEARVIHSADMLSVMFDVLRAENIKAPIHDKYTAKIYSLDNRKHLKQSTIQHMLYVGDRMTTDEVEAIANGEA